MNRNNETMIHAAQKFTIQDVSSNLDLPKSTLRYWEKELGDHIQPLRTRGGQRRYVSGHIEIFRRVQSMKDDGLTLREIKQILTGPTIAGQENGLEYEMNIDSLAERIAVLVRQEVRLFLSDDKHLRTLDRNT